MNSAKPKCDSLVGTIDAPTYIEYPTEPYISSDGEVGVRGWIFAYAGADGVVAGSAMSVMFTIDRPAREVWRYLKDFNLWQRNHFYSGVIGDLEGKTYTLSLKPNDTASTDYRQVIKVVPERLIVTMGLVPKEGTKWAGMPGLGGNVSPGFSAFMLSEHGGKTVVTISMQHASYASLTHDMSMDEALRPWRDAKIMPEAVRKWHEDFIPDLKRLVYAK